MPPNTVKVDRSTKLGNPFTIAAAIESGYATESTAQAFVVECFGDWLRGHPQGRSWWQGPESDARRAAILDALPGLRGMNLACWCGPDQPCHADVELELANAVPTRTPLEERESSREANPIPSDRGGET